MGVKGQLLGIAARDARHAPMREVRRARITIETGVERDARGAPGRRQATVLARAGWTAACLEAGANALPWTARRANLFIDGIDLKGKVGYDLHIGDAVLLITGETKPCEVMDRQWANLRTALVPDWRGGVTCRVTRSGEAEVGSEVRLERRPIQQMSYVARDRVRRAAKRGRALLSRAARTLDGRAAAAVGSQPVVEPARAQPKEMASIAAISYYLGSLKPIDELDFLRENPERLQLYKVGGFEQYAESDLPMRELAYKSAAQTLSACGINPADIGICVYVAESFDRDEPVSSADVNRLLVQLGLHRAVPIHVSIANCANIMAALRVAVAMIRCDEARHVLVVSVDKASRRCGGRKMFQEMSVKSDVSVSCVVSGPGVGPYGVLYLNQHNDAGLMDGSITDAASYSMPKLKSIRTAANAAREALALGPRDFSRIVTNNYSREVTKMFVELCGFPAALGCFDNIPRFAHAVAGDVLINLQDLESGGGVSRDDRIFLMSDSVTSASVLCLQRR